MLNITAHGNIGKDPETREVNGNQVASFSLASRTGKDQTTWLNCQVWGKRADTVMEYMHKGDAITVSGRGKLQEYERKDGATGYSLQLDVNDFTLPPKKNRDDDF
jgi:single-strand DNA-binding protein|tara:strand:+ start:2521 stop:2835 length:315 start_codon:yes stop_codon:yes gene_type:complete